MIVNYWWFPRVTLFGESDSIQLYSGETLMNKDTVTGRQSQERFRSGNISLPARKDRLRWLDTL